MGIAERQAAIVNEIGVARNWQARYRKLINLGRELEPFPEDQRSDANRVKGCQSRVWLYAETLDDGTVRFWGDSDAAIVKGLVAVVLRAFSGATPAEIISAPITFVDELGLGENLSQTRANGLAAMLKQIQLYGVAFAAIGARAAAPR